MNGANFNIPQPPLSNKPFHRQNRRRLRPGARARKALSIRETHQHEYEEGLAVAGDRTVWLPSEGSLQWPSRRGLLFNQGIVRKRAVEDEQYRMYGGDDQDVDDMLRRMGILYENDRQGGEPCDGRWDDEVDEGAESDVTIKATIPLGHYIRPVRPRRDACTRQRQHSVHVQLPAYLAQSLLRDSPEIAPWFQVQHAPPGSYFPTRTTIHHPCPTPQTVPPLTKSLSDSIHSTLSNSGSAFPYLHPELAHSESPLSYSISASPILFPLANDDEDLADATWDFITRSTPASAPPSEPDTWIVLSDDS